jgi:hypothetical protein
MEKRGSRINASGAEQVRLAKLVYSRPTTEEICEELPHMGSALDIAARRLAKFRSVENADALLARLETARAVAQRVRRRLAEEMRS